MKIFLRKFQSYVYLILKDTRASFPIPSYLKLYLWIKGFLSEKYILYRFEENSIKHYLSDYHASISRNINMPFNELLTNKYIFSKTCGLYIKTPEIYGFVVDGVYYPERLEYSKIFLMTNFSKLVVKTVTGGGGVGVYIVELYSDGGVLINNRHFSISAWNDFLASLNNCVVTEYVEPGVFSRSLNEGTVNTMRIVTLVDPITRKPFIAGAVQRIGVKETSPMDNFTKGGVSVSIDIETGILGEGAMHPHNCKYVRLSRHPDTGVVFKGRQIPDWELVKAEVLQAASALPMLKCVGWDILISTDGVVAIEGNHHPDPDVLQAHAPLLIDERVRRFYKYHGIIK